MVPRLDLELCLPGEACVRFSRSPMRLCRERTAGHREIHDRADTLALELADVELPDAGDEAQMVVGTPAAVTVQPIRAHVAMGNGLGVGRRRRVVGAPKVRDRQTLRGERIDEPFLVGLAAVAKGVDARVLAELDPLARETGAVELGEVAAGEVVRDVGRSEDEGRIVKAHREPGGVTARGRWMSMKMCERLSPCEREACAPTADACRRRGERM